MLSFLAVNSTFRGPYTPGSALCLAFALASPGEATMAKVEAASARCPTTSLGLFEKHGGELRRHVKVPTSLSTPAGSSASPSRTARRQRTGGGVEPRPDHDLHPVPRARRPARRFPRRVDAIDHRAAYFQMHFALIGLPEYTSPYEVLNEGTLRHNVTFFGTAEQLQRDYEGCVRGRPRGAVVQPGDPLAAGPGLAPAGKHSASSFAFYLPLAASRAEQSRLRDQMAERVVARITAHAPNFPDLVERQFSYPAHTYELMFGCTGGDFTHGLLQPEFMGPFRPGPRGWPDSPVPVDGLYLCGAGCHGGPGVTFIPGYNCGYAVLEATERVRRPPPTVTADPSGPGSHPPPPGGHLPRRRWRATAAAVATFSESTPSAIGIETTTSAPASAPAESPGPSAPSSNATGCAAADRVGAG